MDLKKRKNLRLKEYKYSSSGAYFVTICTDNRKNTLCSIKNVKEKAEIVLSEYGKIADNVICRIEEKFDIKLNCYVIMPNHIHLVIIIDDEKRAIRESPLRFGNDENNKSDEKRSVVSKVIGYIKMNSSKEIHKKFNCGNVWQRGYYDHIIRNNKDYEKIVQYISENPLRWELDSLYGDN